MALSNPHGGTPQMHTQRATELRRDQRCRSLVYGLMATIFLAEDGSQA
jgi:hypothetical protein